VEKKGVENIQLMEPLEYCLEVLVDFGLDFSNLGLFNNHVQLCAQAKKVVNASIRCNNNIVANIRQCTNWIICKKNCKRFSCKKFVGIINGKR
jgi:hypothetical protein